MKKYKALVLITVIAAALSVFAACNPAETDDGKLSVYTSFYPMYDFASKIGGDKVSVTNMVPAGAEPHDWEPSSSDIIGLEKADVFVYSGADMEHWTDDILKSLSNKKLVSVEASAGIDLLESESGHSHDGDGQAHDPHVWLSPVNAKAQMTNIADGLKQADPDNAEYYNQNLTKYLADLDALDGEFHAALDNVTAKNIVVSHQAFGYLCAEYGLKQLGIDGLSSDSEPSPAKMAEIVDFVKANGVKAIFFVEMSSDKVAAAIARETGTKVSVLSPIEALTDEQRANGDDYFSVMRENLSALKNALQ